ncbi:MAG: CRISPR system precrRNA processing endoribonuclease RAMP protein Cas6, partial [Thermoanaerobaculia bacterium]
DRFAGLYGEQSSDLLRPEIRSVVEAEAVRVPLLADTTRWIEVPDYSARSGAEMLLGGKVGRLLYGGEAARFLPILRAGEILHVGKNTASGCGRIQVDLPPPALP